MRTRRVTASGTALLLATLAGVVSHPGSALAAGCSGDSCAGYDPIAMNCPVTSTTSADAVRNGIALATVWNRYSTACNANWGRAQLSDFARKTGDQLYVEISTNDVDGDYLSEFMCYPNASTTPSNAGLDAEDCAFPQFSAGYTGAGPAWTDMVDGTLVTYATVLVYDQFGNYLASMGASQ